MLLIVSFGFFLLLRIYSTDISHTQIRGMCSDKEVFIKRRNRLIGKDNKTLSALEGLTNCSVTVQGSTVAIIGPHKGVLKVSDDDHWSQ